MTTSAPRSTRAWVHEPASSYESFAAWPTSDTVLRCIDAYMIAGVTKFVFRPLISGPAINDQFARPAHVADPRTGRCVLIR
jgi:hypothetical protein